MKTEIQKELEAIRKELREATARAERLAGSLDEEQWSKRPASGGWSPAECLVHLNLTAEQFLPLIREQVRRGTEQRLVGVGPYRKDLKGRLLTWVIEPPVRRLKVKTSEAFVPQAESKDRVLARFGDLQAELEAEILASDGLDLNRLKLASPFNSRLKYNLFSCFAIITAHERRHLWQAEQAAGQLQGVGRS